LNEKFPPQHQQRQPGREHEMAPQPEVIRSDYRGSGKLRGKVAIVTGGDSGIGRAVAVHFAREGAKVVIGYLEEDKDAQETRDLVEAEGQACCLFRGDLGEAALCRSLADEAVSAFGRIDVLVNNGAEQHAVDTLEEVTPEQWDRTFRTNIHAYFYLTRAALPHMEEGSSIINTTSVNAYKGNAKLIAYTATKSAIVGFTRSIALTLVERGIRVNGVAPGPVWTPLIPATFPEDDVAKFGGQVPMNRAGQPSEIAPSYVFLASSDASYITGQVIHPNGGTVVNG
jgi:NAD(P)-dependent dehydrogenase (short-subunit alcohol dehydrogenase family)